jgi:hypothetical protein
MLYIVVSHSALGVCKYNIEISVLSKDFQLNDQFSIFFSSPFRALASYSVP